MPAKRETITVAAAQLEARLMNEADVTLQSIDLAIHRAAQKRVDLLVLPECAYPAYLLGSVTSYRSGNHLRSDEFVAWLQERAARHRLHIVCGLVEDDGTHVYNGAVLIDERGQEVGRARKRFLWNADHDWYEPGQEIRAFDTAIGRIGIVICAEARDPELVATLVADGAELIAMPTCWINASRDPGRYENPQVEFLIEARAREFGVPFVCADKCGFELAPVGYVGMSRIVRADGTLAAEAPPTGETVIAARLVVRRPRRVWISERRRAQLASEPVRPPATSQRIKVAAMPTSVANARYQGGMGHSLFEPLQKAGVNVLLVDMPQEAQGEQLAMLANAFDLRAVAFPIEPNVFTCGPAKVGVVSGQWVRTFAASRALALQGAQILMYFDAVDDLPMLCTRALENRVFVMASGERSAVIIDPSGNVLARTNPGQLAEVIAEIDLADAANKQIAPRTDIFEERRPALYRY